MTKGDFGLASVLAAVEDVLPRLRANANEAEDRYWIPDENIALPEKAGVLPHGRLRRDDTRPRIEPCSKCPIQIPQPQWTSVRSRITAW